jgi:hypothetical protein
MRLKWWLGKPLLKTSRSSCPSSREARHGSFLSKPIKSRKEYRAGDMEGSEYQRRWRSIRTSLGIGAILLFLAGLSVGFLLREPMLGMLLFAFGAILFALRGYLETKDKVLAGALIFVALVAIGIEAVVYFLVP